MKFALLGSGSTGNSGIVEGPDGLVLLDAGFSLVEIERRLARLGIRPEEVGSVVVTHHHIDHVRSAHTGVRRHGWALHCTPGTWSLVPRLQRIESVRLFNPGDLLRLAGLEIQTVPLAHDAPDTVGLVVRDPASSLRVGLCTDAGHLDEATLAAFRHCDALVLEANHDPELLRRGPYPPALKARVRSDLGHLSNEQAAAAAAALVHDHLQHLVLGHLSETNNTVDHVRAAVTAPVNRAGFRGQLHVALQSWTTPLFDLGRADALVCG